MAISGLKHPGWQWSKCCSQGFKVGLHKPMAHLGPQCVQLGPHSGLGVGCPTWASPGPHRVGPTCAPHFMPGTGPTVGCPCRLNFLLTVGPKRACLLGVDVNVTASNIFLSMANIHKNVYRHAYTMYGHGALLLW